VGLGGFGETGADIAQGVSSTMEEMKSSSGGGRKMGKFASKLGFGKKK